MSLNQVRLANEAFDEISKEAIRTLSLWLMRRNFMAGHESDDLYARAWNRSLLILAYKTTGTTVPSMAPDAIDTDVMLELNDLTTDPVEVDRLKKALMAPDLSDTKIDSVALDPALAETGEMGSPKAVGRIRITFNKGGKTIPFPVVVGEGIERLARRWNPGFAYVHRGNPELAITLALLRFASGTAYSSANTPPPSLSSNQYFHVAFGNPIETEGSFSSLNPDTDGPFGAVRLDDLSPDEDNGVGGLILFSPPPIAHIVSTELGVVDEVVQVSGSAIAALIVTRLNILGLASPPAEEEVSGNVEYLLTGLESFQEELFSKKEDKLAAILGAPGLQDIPVTAGQTVGYEALLERALA